MSRYDVGDVRAAVNALGPRGLADRLGLPRLWGREQLRGACPIHKGGNRQAFALGSRSGRLLWQCFTGCGGGDGLDLIAALEGIDAKADFPRLLAVAAELAGVDPAEHGAPRRRATRRWQPPPPEPPTYPYREDVLALWDAGRSMRNGERRTLSAEVGDWLTRRGIDGHAAYRAGVVVPLDAVPCLPHAEGDHPPAMPQWARRWFASGYRALFALYDEAGMLRSVRARHVLPDAKPDRPKTLAPKGFNVAGLVLATLAAVRWLRGYDELGRLVILEGETDLLTAMQAWPQFPAVGLVSAASWTDAMAAKVPDGARVLVATDHDKTGDTYASVIAASLHGRCDLRRATTWT
jgi:Toprim-like